MAAAPSQSGKTLTATGPIIIVILVIAAALLGYYQIAYYPSGHVSTSTTTQVISTTPHNVTVIIPVGAPVLPTPQSFSPDHIVVVVGYNSTVFWKNNDTVEHTITSAGGSPDPRFDTFGPDNPQDYNNIQAAGTPGDELNFTFTIAGNYSYFCSYHANMKGSVLVVASNSSLVSGSSGTAEIKSFISSSLLGNLVDEGYHFSLSAETAFARSLATLIGSGIAPWSVNLSKSLFDSFSPIPEFLTKTS